MELGELSSRGWEESDNDGEWSKQAVVHITPHKKEQNDDEDDENEFARNIDNLNANLQMMNNGLERVDRAIQYRWSFCKKYKYPVNGR